MQFWLLHIKRHKQVAIKKQGWQSKKLSNKSSSDGKLKEGDISTLHLGSQAVTT